MALKLPEQKMKIEPGWQWGAAAQCPECGRDCLKLNSAPMASCPSSQISEDCLEVDSLVTFMAFR